MWKMNSYFIDYIFFYYYYNVFGLWNMEIVQRNKVVTSDEIHQTPVSQTQKELQQQIRL